MPSPMPPSSDIGLVPLVFWIRTYGDDDGVHAYCLFCETRKCADIAATLQKQTGHRCFAPQIIQRKWVKGKAQEERHAWLPGYIFIYTEQPVLPRFPAPGVLRCLGNDELSGRDLEFAEMLYRRDGIMGTIRLAEEGDRCKVADPAWEGMHGTVVKLDRGRKRCCVEFVFDGTKWNVWVGYELVELDTSDQKETDKESVDRKIIDAGK